MKPTRNVHSQELAIYEGRLRFLNRDLAMFTAGLAFGTAATDAPVQFAYGAMFVVLLLIYHHDRPYGRIFKLWREVDHPLIQVRRVWRDYLPIGFAWLALGLVAVGIVNKHGIVLG